MKLFKELNSLVHNVQDWRAKISSNQQPCNYGDRYNANHSKESVQTITLGENAILLKNISSQSANNITSTE